MNYNIGVSGKFRCEVFRYGERVLDTGFFPNLILDSGLDAIMGGASQTTVPIQSIVAGTGNSVPTASQTSLDRQVMESSRNGNSSGPIWSTDSEGRQYSYIRRQYSFSPSASNLNISELGLTIYNGPMRIGLFSRTLVRDPEGNPTTIPLLTGDELRVTYELRFYPPEEDVVVEKGEYVFTIRPLGIGTSASSYVWSPFASWSISSCKLVPTDLPSREAPISTSGTVSNTSVRKPYVPGSFRMEFEYSWTTASSVTAKHLQVPGISGGYYGPVFGVGIEPPLPKTSSNVLSITLGLTASRVEIE